MNTFLQNIKTKLNNKINNLTLILGNESCDLDSAISALVYARFLNWQHCELEGKDDAYVPILNVAREDFEIKTEVNYCLKSNFIDTDLLIFRDDHDYEVILNSGNSKVVLVDHHILCKEDMFFKQYICDIIDHRPKDNANWSYKENINNTIKIVGSCCTLILKRMQSESNNCEDFFEGNKECAELLYNTIILDTVNFSKEVNKATPLDVEAVAELERILQINDTIAKRESILNKLLKARSDVSALNSKQLLKKDIKIIEKILIPSFPILVYDFLQKLDVESSMKDILERTNTNLLLLLGMEINGDRLRRDLAVFAKNDNLDEAEKLSMVLEENNDLKLIKKDSNINNCDYYEQNNLSASRKQVIPIVNKFLSGSKK